MEEGYTVAQAAVMLGRSPRLVRKLMTDGRIETVPGSSPTRVTEASVLVERRKRKPSSSSASPRPRADAGITREELRNTVEEAVRAAIEALTTEVLRPQLEARDAVEQRLREALAESEAGRQQLAAQLERQQQRGWLRRIL